MKKINWKKVGLIFKYIILGAIIIAGIFLVRDAILNPDNTFDFNYHR